LHRQGHRDAAAIGHPALPGHEPRLRADQEPLGVLHRAGPGVVAEIRAGLFEFRRRAALGGQAADPDPAGATRRTGKPRIIETEAFFQFHFANGFEEDGTLVLDVARYPDYRTIGQALRDYWKSEWPSQGMATLTRLRVDLSTGKVGSRTYDSGRANEFPIINPANVGKRQRYAYIACNPADRVVGLQQQLARIDLETGAVAKHDFGPDGYPGEPLFIATRPGGAEDDGVVVTLVFDAARQRTDIVGLDARDLAAKPLFVAKLKHHVPYSLHGTFTPRLV